MKLNLFRVLLCFGFDRLAFSRGLAVLPQLLSAVRASVHCFLPSLCKSTSMVLESDNLMLAGADYTLDVILNTKMDVMLCVYIYILLWQVKR